MQRRNAIKNIGLFTGGLFLLGSCDFSNEKVSIILNKLKINIDQETLLKEIVATIIPEGKIPGAKTLKVPNFVWVMVDDCTSKEKQESFMNGLNIFSQTFGKNFITKNTIQKLKTLQDILENKEANKEVLSFLHTTKYYTIKGYMSSEYIMTEEMPYKLVPGIDSYEGCKTIDNTQKININA